MAKKITELPVSDPYDGSEKILMAQAGVTVAGPLSALDDYITVELYDDSLLQSTSANWDESTSVVQSNSAAWDAHTDPYDDSLLQSTSAIWDSTYTTVSANSASWIENTTPQTVSASNIFSFDVSLGYNADVTMTADIVVLQLDNAQAGDSGLFEVRVSGGPWTWTTTTDPTNVMTGDLADIVNLTTSNDIITIGYYYDGTNNLLYVSDINTI